LSWSTNGFAGTVIVLNGRFSINGDRGLLIPKMDKIDILYLRYVLEPVFRELAKGRKGDRGEDEFTKLYPSMIADVDIPLPVDDKGEICLSAQKEIAAIYDTVEQYRREVLGKLDFLLNQRIEY
jgi:restriction endonuclease S subunit